MATRAEEFEELYHDERARLSRATVSLAGSRTEDIVHDAFLTYLTRGDDVAAPRAWLGRVARNRALNDLRRAREVPLPDDISHEQPPAAVERDAVRALVADALGDLDDRSRAALRLRFFEERSYEQIAEDLDVRVAQAHVVVHRSVRRLGRALVRRLAEAHGVASCAPALEEIAGLGRAANGHGAAACDRCRPVLDELAALRSLGLLVPAGGFMLRRIGADAVVRGPEIVDTAGRLANAVVALGLAATTVLIPARAPEQAQRPADVPRARVAPATVERTAEQRPARAEVSDRRSGQPATKDARPDTIVDDGPIVVRSDEHHTQGEVKGEDGAPAGGAVVCQPLQPCPPPPSPGS